MNNALFGLIAAVLWGGGDFAGSFAVRRTGGTVRGSLGVVVFGHWMSLAVLLAVLLTIGEGMPRGAAVAWGVGGGAIAGISLVAFYLALASGPMGSAAAVSGLLCAAVPAVVSSWTEGAPSAKRIAGFVFAAAAIWLIAGSAHPGEHASRKSMTLSVLGGIGFGIYFVALKYAGEAGLVWPLAFCRIGSSSVCALLLLGMVFRTQGAVLGNGGRGRTLAWVAAGAALDTGGNLSYIAATRAGRLDVAAVLASIYPASTILLAAGLLHERVTVRQKIGMALALPAVVLITL